MKPYQKAQIARELERTLLTASPENLIQAETAMAPLLGTVAPKTATLPEILAAIPTLSHADLGRVKQAILAQEQASLAVQLTRSAGLRALAVRARELFGHDVADFEVKTWVRGADRRCYIGCGFDANWVEYWQTGNDRVAPRTLKVHFGLASLAKHRQITEDEAKTLIQEYCDQIATLGVDLKVTEDNAPCDPAAKITRWQIRSASGKLWSQKNTRWWDDGTTYSTEDEAKAALVAYQATPPKAGGYPIQGFDAATVCAVEIKTPFPPMEKPGKP